MTIELEKLKNTWHAVVDSDTSKSFSSDELKRIVNRRSNNEISKIRRKIIFECVISILFSVGLIVFVQIIDSSKTIWVSLYISLIVALSLFPYLKVVRFSVNGGSDLKQHLSSYIKAFDNLVYQSVKIYTFLIPIGMLSAYLLGFSIGVHLENKVYEFRTLDLIIGLTVVGSVTFIGYLILKRYFKWIYGKNISRLKDCLADLNRGEE